MMDTPSYAELLTAVDDLLSFVDGIEPVAIGPTPDPNKPACEFRPHPGAVRLTDAQEAGFLAREHHVIRLAECCGLSERVLHLFGWCKTGFSIVPAWKRRDEFTRDLSDWKDRIGGFRLLVAELAGGAVETSDAASIVLTLTDPKPDPTRASYGLDCRCVNWYGTVYHFSPIQAACVKVLIEHFKHGVPELGESTILTSEWVDSSQQRLAGVFENGKHPAWSTMIKPGSTKGTFRLAKPGE